jgi:hypothetical protein
MNMTNVGFNTGESVAKAGLLERLLGVCASVFSRLDLYILLNLKFQASAVAVSRFYSYALFVFWRT